LCIVLEPKIIAVVGTVLIFHIFCLGFPTLVRFRFIEEDAIEAYMEVGAARLALVAPGHEFKGNGVLALVTPFHSLSRSSLRRCSVFPLFPCD
jgi:hypothetical protein